MMVTFVSQCEKQALKRTRRVLDAFADRIGDNTWQTVITAEGLQAVHKLLRRSVSKNTAVSCHWIRSRSRSDLLWVIGSKNKFDSQGRAPVNSTRSNLIQNREEDRWQHAHSIQIVAVLAALLHDIGKATVGFQNKLFGSGIRQADPYRHEWISLRLFEAMIAGCNSDDEWLDRLMQFEDYQQQHPNWLEHWRHDGTANKPSQRLNKHPPLAQLIIWLVVTHHRLPTYKASIYQRSQRHKQQHDPYYWGIEDGEAFSIETFYGELMPADYWVRNPDTKLDSAFQTLKASPLQNRKWLKGVTRWARKAKTHKPLRDLAQQPISDPFLMHLARLCLMLGDHNYSSLKANDPARLQGDTSLAVPLYANTDSDHQPKQTLDEHLLGVAKFTNKIARDLPALVNKLADQFSLPEKLHTFTKNTDQARFKWQNKAFALAHKLNKDSQEQGFFGVNMASTGQGKTLANARIMYALSPPEKGARFTIALGLRVLTLQTGKALRQRLKLSDDQLAILVGGQASTLFELGEKPADSAKFEKFGSESLEELLAPSEEVWSDSTLNELLGKEYQTLLQDKKVQQLLTAPVISCTVDHLMQASECNRGGRYIAPVLRLLSSDLVLDEPDDFDHNDLPALSRLIHLLGLYGGKLLLSSATLTPDMLQGLFLAYAAGRKIFNQHMGLNPNLPVTCAWFDENRQSHAACGNQQQYTEAHQQFAQRRAQYLSQQPVRRRAAILPLDLPAASENSAYPFQLDALAQTLIDGAIRLHQAHAQSCAKTGKQVSIGLLRMANIEPLIQVVLSLFQSAQVDNNVQVHLCCYHAKQLLLLRNQLEQKLDRLLSRGTEDPFLQQPEVQQALQQSKARHHIFLVASSPVAEIGRDHDYDWAIAEPSSMRSLIQLAGRIWRHRPDKQAQQPNLLILDKNIKALKNEKLCFSKPGFEQPEFLLPSHSCLELIPNPQLQQLDSVPRIIADENAQSLNTLADLEHAVMRKLLNRPDNFVGAFWREHNGNRASAHLQKISPFRANDLKQTDYVCLPNAQTANGFDFVMAESAWDDINHHATQNAKFTWAQANVKHQPQIQPWLSTKLFDSLEALSDQLEEDDLRHLARRFASVSLDEKVSKWWFHPDLGFWANET